MSLRSRKFSCITYLNEIQIQACLTKHVNQVRCYEYIYHDKDTYTEYDESKNPEHKAGELKVPHYHLVIVTHCTCTCSAIRKWFKGYVDSNGEITTTAQVCSDVFAMDEYLTHRDSKSRALGKYIYPLENIVCSDKKYFGAHLESQYDNSVLASEMLLRGVDVRTVGKIFGKDFIYHYNTIKQYVNDIQVCEKHNLDNMSELLDYQHFGNSALWAKEENSERCFKIE